MPPPPPRYSRNSHSAMEGQKHRRPGTPPTCPGQRRVQRTERPARYSVESSFARVASSSRPRLVRQTPNEAACLPGASSLWKKSATANRGFFLPRAFPRRAPLGLPPESRIFFGTLRARATIPPPRLHFPPLRSSPPHPLPPHAL